MVEERKPAIPNLTSFSSLQQCPEFLASSSTWSSIVASVVVRFKPGGARLSFRNPRLPCGFCAQSAMGICTLSIGFAKSTCTRSVVASHLPSTGSAAMSFGFSLSRERTETFLRGGTWI
ncbi:hypothetical protein M3J09_012987 [Ascochyta lentis]